MAKVDLHAHSKYSNHPSEWFLQRLGAAESYTEPEAIYRMARSRGMDFVTVTDHNCMRASLELVAKYPEHCFSGVEATAYFPEDGCKVHVLIYGLDRTNSGSSRSCGRIFINCAITCAIRNWPAWWLTPLTRSTVA